MIYIVYHISSLLISPFHDDDDDDDYYDDDDDDDDDLSRFPSFDAFLKRAYSHPGLMTECFGERRGPKPAAVADRKRLKEKQFEDAI